MSLECLFNPASVAFVGAAHTETKLGGVLLRNLLRFTGKVFPINPNYANSITSVAVVCQLPGARAIRHVQEVFRALAPGGSATFSFWDTGQVKDAWRQRACVYHARSGWMLEGPHRLRGVTAAELGQIVMDAGFVVTEYLRPGENMTALVVAKDL